MKRNLIYYLGLFACIFFLLSCDEKIEPVPDNPTEKLADVKAIWSQKHSMAIRRLFSQWVSELLSSI